MSYKSLYEQTCDMVRKLIKDIDKLEARNEELLLDIKRLEFRLEQERPCHRKIAVLVKKDLDGVC